MKRRAKVVCEACKKGRSISLHQVEEEYEEMCGKAKWDEALEGVEPEGTRPAEVHIVAS